MTDFDKLIKEKTEQAEYAYKPSAWRNFKRVSGSASPLRYWIVGSVSAVVLGGAVATALYFAPNRQPREVADNPAMTVDSMLVDSESPVESQDTVSFSPKMVANPVSHTTPTKTTSGTTPAEAAVSMPMSRPDTLKKPQRTAVRLGRPLVIDVDTIKDNVPTDEELRTGHSRLF